MVLVSTGSIWSSEPSLPCQTRVTEALETRLVCVSLVFLLYTLASRYLAASPSCFYCFLLYFSVCFVRCRIFFRLRAFLSVQACCILFISVHFGSSYMFSLVPRASVTFVQRNGKTKTSGKHCFGSTFHWPLTEHAQLHRKLKNNNFVSRYPIAGSQCHAISK